MAGSSNFLEFDTNQTNIMTDTNYNNSSTRSDGVVEGIADPLLHNKLFRQSSVMVAAIGQWLASIGYTVDDTSVNNLALVLANIITSAGGTIGGNLTVSGTTTLSGTTTFGSTATLNADPTLALQAATKQYVDNHTYTLPTASTNVLGGVKVGNGLNISNGSLSTSAVSYVTSEYLNSPGYKIYSSGYKDMWGTIPALAAEASTTVYFPTLFSSGIFSITATPFGSYSMSGDNGCLQIVSATTSSFVVVNTGDDVMGGGTYRANGV